MGEAKRRKKLDPNFGVIPGQYNSQRNEVEQKRENTETNLSWDEETETNLSWDVQISEYKEFFNGITPKHQKGRTNSLEIAQLLFTKVDAGVFYDEGGKSIFIPYHLLQERGDFVGLASLINCLESKKIPYSSDGLLSGLSLEEAEKIWTPRSIKEVVANLVDLLIKQFNYYDYYDYIPSDD